MFSSGFSMIGSLLCLSFNTATLCGFQLSQMAVEAITDDRVSFSKTSLRCLDMDLLNVLEIPHMRHQNTLVKILKIEAPKCIVGTKEGKLITSPGINLTRASASLNSQLCFLCFPSVCSLCFINLSMVCLLCVYLCLPGV